ncbi:MAG: hypothetical protein KDD84_24480, partial [Caldilineaceae bacterium]|nr:hypothetical protein [Caldilineaceae bacterium]
QADGKILLAGESRAANYDFALVRYNVDGSLDTGFDGDGMVTTAIGAGQDTAYDVAVQADGKILLTGTDGSNLTVVRYATDGSLDTGFGGTGIVTTDIGSGNDTGKSIAVQSDGKIVIGGISFNGSDFDIALVRYNVDGTLDGSFGSGGIVTTPIGGNSDWAYSVAIQADGRIVVGGVTGNGSDYDVALLRYDTDGSLDATFGSGGIVTTDLGGSDDAGYAMLLQPDGRIVVVGDYYNGSAYDFLMLRYNSDGSLDTDFAPVNTLDGNPTFTEGGAAVVLDADVDVSDPELDALNGGAGNYDGASLTIVRNGGANAQDVLSIADGNGITFAGGTLYKNGQIIASFDTTSTPGELVVTFTDAGGEIPTSVDVDNILSQITYANSSDNPPASVQLDWMFDDGNSGDQGSGGNLAASGSTTVNITAVNDTPVVSGPSSAYSATEQTTLAIHGTGFSVTDADAASGTMTATIQVGEGAITVVTGDSGISISGGNGSSLVTLTGTLAQIDSLLTGSGTGTINYFNNSNTPSASTTITVTVNDGGNTGTDPGTTADGSSEEDSAVQTINITATNDDPTNVGSLPSDITVTEDVATNVDLSAVDFSDVDAASGTLTVTLTTATGGQLASVSGGGVIVAGTPTAKTFTGTLTNLNTFFNDSTKIQYLHGT